VSCAGMLDVAAAGNADGALVSAAAVCSTNTSTDVNVGYNALLGM
jgi:hypothetical protein